MLERRDSAPGERRQEIHPAFLALTVGAREAASWLDVETIRRDYFPQAPAASASAGFSIHIPDPRLGAIDFR